MSAGWYIKPDDSEIIDRVTNSTWWCDTTTGEIKMWDGAGWVVKSVGVIVGGIYIVAPYRRGRPGSSELMLLHPVGEDFTIPAGAGKSHGKSNVAAAATATFSLRKNGVQFGTAEWASAATTATFTVASDTSFSESSGDYLSIIAPSSQDSTLADIGITIYGDR